MGVCRGRLKKLITLPKRAANGYWSYSASGSLQAMVVSRGWVCAGEGLRKYSPSLGARQMPYGSYSASGSVQAMVVSRGWVFAREASTV